MGVLSKKVLDFGRSRAVPWALLLAACGGDGSAEGSLTILLEPEDVITQGLLPGEGLENIRDGWGVQFEKYLIAVGHIELYYSTDTGKEADADDVYVVDLKKLPTSGLALWQIESLKAGSWEFHYETAGAAHGAERHESVNKADFDEMVENDFTYLIRGTLSKSNGESCPPTSLADAGEKTPNGNASAGNDCYDAPVVDFEFGATAETVFGPCEIEGVPGVAIPDGGNQTVAITIHGDHLFFNGFPEGSEGGVMRLAQWLADCDLDLDGVVTQQELEAIELSDLPEIDSRFQLGGSPVTPLVTVYDYVIAQLKTQGHYQGEGECPIDGVDHEHGDDDDD
jgi:hypothetical protein